MIQEAAEQIRRSQKTVVLTGAGMSTESQIPDFRSESGWWQQVDPMSLATIEAIETNYDQVHAFYEARLKALQKATPNRGHLILADWEKAGMIDAVATQNVDGLHQAAGSQTVYALHGNIRQIRCHRCQVQQSLDAFHAKEACHICGGPLRPGVVLFGEMLPQEAWHNALAEIEQADVVLVIGTSLEVYPVNQLPGMTSGTTIYLNQEITQNVHHFDLVIEGSAGEALREIDARL
nr:NAD-dependent deacylase [Salisediminibacterium beveridgei]